MKRFAFELTRVIVHHVEAKNEAAARKRLDDDIGIGETSYAFDQAESQIVLLDVEDVE